MKNFMLRISLLLILVCSLSCLDAQRRTSEKQTTIILLRHAEKDTINGNDPPLSAVGMARAERLEAAFPEVKPDLFYSTNYNRTKSTLLPWVKHTNKKIKPYYANKQGEFAQMLLKEKGKTIVVAGHSNTIPSLVNLFIGQDKYQNLPDNEYGKIFIVTINKGKAEVTIKSY
jgi:2,3-bisphosphoglycerate-dependent phosphoglycerate mutase